MVGDDDQPATKGELRATKDELRSEISALGAELRSEISELRSEMQAMERRIVLDLSGVVQRAMNIAVEQIGSKIGVVDEKYQDLPARVTALETGLAEHRADLALHERPPAPAPRVRRSPRKPI